MFRVASVDELAKDALRRALEVIVADASAVLEFLLRSSVVAHVVEQTRARASIEILADMPLRRHLLPPLLPRIWELRANLTAYDAAYVALAEALACPLLTPDEKLGRTPGHTARVITPEAG